VKEIRITEDEYIFKRKYEELEHLVSSKDDYDVLKISAILRLLLLEGLMHKANKRFKIHVSFKIGIRTYKIPGFPDPDVWSAQDGIYPPSSRTPHIFKEVKVDKFLSTPLMKLENEILTLKDIIRYEANVKGGVHVGKVNKNKPKESILESSSIFQVGNFRLSLRQLIAIGKVTLDGLKPIYLELLK